MGALTMVASITAAAIAYVSSRRALTAQLARSSELLANSVRSHSEHLVHHGIPQTDALVRAWHATRGDQQGLYLCFIGPDAKLNVHTRYDERVGTSVASMQAASPDEPPAQVRDLLAERRSWSGENVTLFGKPQVVSFSYSEPLAGLVTVHVPQAVIAARARQGMLPWAYGLGFVALVLMPCALVLMHLAYRRSQRALARAHAEQSELSLRLERSQRLEAIGRLAGGVAHDFNNLLTVMQVSADNLRYEPLSAAAAQEVEQIDAAAQKGAEMIGQLLAFGTTRADHQALEVGPMLDNMGELLRRAAGAAVDLKLEVEEGLGSVRANRMQLEQVLLNLVVNARDASQDGAAIHVRAQRVDPRGPQPEPDAGVAPSEGSWLRISVRDEGTGISREVLERIFEPFFTTKDPGRGTGLGLATAHAIVHQHGGHLTVHSEEGAGTSVDVYLPLESATPATAPTEDAAREPGSGRRARVLLVEDQDDVRRALMRLLERCGHEVEAVGEAQAARARFGADGERPFELVVSDVAMPGERGDTLAEDLIGRDPALRVLLVSGNDMTAGQRARDPRIAFLAKPFSRETLDAKLRELLG